MVLLESKRDDMLLPYIELLKSKGINTNLREFKGYMLKKLTNEGRMRNLSLGSNFYLAGAVRYYFNGDLTLNKDLDIFNNGETQNDVWNEDVCMRLNALINILRNAYIDTIGETFEQPEDFGTLTLPKLLKKYNKKIEKELAGETDNVDKEEEGDSIDRTPNVGNNYTFDIIYNYSEATKYNKYTEPGAWCITYAPGHYKDYIRRLNIHYVIFKQDGFEGVPRVKGENWTKEKPQDEYGCSLIALLQHNETGEPIFITSRWNHGYYPEGTNCEADHAFTKEEFFEKTGVTDADLQRIFEIWKKDKEKYTGAKEVTSVSRVEKLYVLRQLKYAQMKMNGGNFDLSDTIQIVVDLGGGNEDKKLNKSLFLCRTSFDSEHQFYFLLDRGKIVFETIVPKTIFESAASSYAGYAAKEYNNLAIFITSKYILLYDMRTHSLITIDDEYKFKCVPNIRDTAELTNNTFYSVVVGKHQMALLSLSNNKPLRLPNGRYWINRVEGTASGEWPSTIGRTNLAANIYGNRPGSILDLIYDMSSGEHYYYDVDSRKFLPEEIMPKIEDKVLKIHKDVAIPGFMIFSVLNSPKDYYYFAPNIIFKDGKQIDINGHSFVYQISYFGGGILRYSTDVNGHRNNNYYLYDLVKNKPLIFPDGTNIAHRIEGADRGWFYNSRLLFINGYKHGWSIYFIYDKKEHKFLKNPCMLPNEYEFIVCDRGYSDGSGVIIATTENHRSPYSYGNRERDIDWVDDYGVLYIPGVENIKNETFKKSLYKDVKIIGGPNESENFSDTELQQMVREVVEKIIEKRK